MQSIKVARQQLADAQTAADKAAGSSRAHKTKLSMDKRVRKKQEMVNKLEAKFSEYSTHIHYLK